MNLMETMCERGHEKVLFVNNEKAGLKAIIAVHLPRGMLRVLMEPLRYSRTPPVKVSVNESWSTLWYSSPVKRLAVTSPCCGF